MDPQKDLTLVEVILKLHGDHPGKFALFYALVVLFVFALLVTAWQLFGAGPRRQRGLRGARAVLARGDWKAALAQLERVRMIGSPSTSWITSFDQFEAECLQRGAQAEMAGSRFEEALKLGKRAAEIRGEPDTELRMHVQSAMLHEVRRLFSKQGETNETLDLIIQAMKVQSPCREASFWQAMCEIRLGTMDIALMHLQTARTGLTRAFDLDTGFTGAATRSPRGRETGIRHPAGGGAGGEDDAGNAGSTSSFVDPSLYLGAILLRMGQAKESLRFLTEANRMDPNCPFITLHLGAAIIEAGGDTNTAVRALQRALGPKGLGQWLDNPDRAWVEAFPEDRSYIHKLADEFPFLCPLFGEDLKYLIRQGNLALAQAYFKLENFAGAAELFDKVLKEGAPSLLVLRGLGLSLAKLGRFDDAFVHLRTAHEMEDVKDRITAGYLALCGAGGKPPRPEDKLQNIAWAIKLVTQFNAPGDEEWVALLNRIFAEARQHAIPLSNDDQVYLCEHLVSVKACDAVSAQAFHFLRTTAPELIHAEYAWLFCQADAEHNVGGDQLLSLYALTFSNQETARAYYSERGWNLDDVELAFLYRAAELAPGRFPEVLGLDYSPRGEQLLLAKAQQLDDAGQREQALKTIEILVKLSPQNTSAMDRAAMLHYRAGRLERAHDLLEQWHQARPEEPVPLVRQAILLHQRGDSPGGFTKVNDALKLASGRRRANIAFLGARLALQRFLDPKPQATDADTLPNVQRFLEDCLASDPGHVQAQWCLAAIRWLSGDTATLAAQAEQMKNVAASDPRYHYLAALCQLVGNQLEGVLASSDRVAQQVGRNGTTAQRTLAIEAGYLAALAQIGLQNYHAAVDALKPATFNPASPTLPYAQALLGAALFQENRHDEALSAWQALDQAQRQAWRLNEPLAQTMFLSALDALKGAQYEQAAEKLRQAGKLGCRDRRLGPLLLLSLFKAGQQAIYKSETAPVVETAVSTPLEPVLSEPEA